jgi:hypothetical protein
MLARKPMPSKPVPPNQKVNDMHRNALRELLSLTLLSLALLAPSLVCAMPVPAPDAVFSPILPKLKATKVPVLLPADTNRKGELGMPDSDHARIENVSSSRYEIVLEVGPDCQGATACYIGTISGEKISPKLAQLKGKKIKLGQGQTAYFTDATCGANCSDSSIVWDQGGVRYYIGMKGEKLDILKRVADSVVFVKQ